MRSPVAIITAATLVGLSFAGMSTVASAQGQIDLMAIADGNSDGKVTIEEYTAFSEQGWGFVSQGKDAVKVADLDANAQLAFFGIEPDEAGNVTQQMYLDAIPARFEMFDGDKDGSLTNEELNGSATQG